MTLKKIKSLLNYKIETVFKKLNITHEIFGDNIYAKCPIHAGSDNPRAFSYSIKRGIWKCWTRDCQNEYSNDVFGLIGGVLSSTRGNKVELKDILDWCNKTLQISSNELLDEQEHEDDFLNIIYQLNKNHNSYEDILIQHNFNIIYPSTYFLNRGFKKSTLKHFHVGECADNSTMKNRAIIPIYNDSGDGLVGLIGRSTKEYIIPKFLIYPKGFNKRYYLYNYHNAFKQAKETSCLYIVEGQGDVWKLYEAGVKNCVGLFGKSFSEEQIQKLYKLPITHLIVLMDNDQPGREARIQIQRQLSRTYKLTFPHLTHKDIGDMDIKTIKKDILSNLNGTY